ncbi:MAG: TlpA family protein disulfide reductase [Bdellovibrionales bacterium]
MKLNIILTIFAIAIGFGATQFWGSVPSQSSQKVQRVPLKVEDKPAQEGVKVPDVQLSTIDGKTLHLDDLLDHDIILNFWASWCAPCIVELPQLLTVARNNPEKFVILLSSDLTVDALDTFLEKLPDEDIKQKNVIIAWDEKGKVTRGVFQTFQLPETVLIDEKGVLRHKIVGLVDWESDEVLKLISGM